MGDNSRIEWTGATWNPIRARRLDTGKTGWHCEHVSEACRNCYAETFNRRNLPNGGTGLKYERRSRDQVEIFLDDKTLTAPLRWTKPRKIFVCSMTDLFGEFVSWQMIYAIWRVMRSTPQHTYQILTKRPQRMYELMKSTPGQVGLAGLPALPNVWLGVTAENQATADARIPHLLETPAAVRFVSIEPMLGPVDLRHIQTDMVEIDALTGDHGVIRPHRGRSELKLHWVIAGGESGSQARPSDLTWFRSLRDQCRSARIPFFMKQITGRGRKLPFESWPEDLRVREFPAPP